MARNVAVNPSAANDLTRWSVNGSVPTRVTGLVGPPKSTGAQRVTGSGAFSTHLSVGGAATSAAGVQWTLSAWLHTTVARTLRCYMATANNDSFVSTVSAGSKDVAMAANTWTPVILVQNTPSGSYNNIRFHVDLPTAVTSTLTISSVRMDTVNEPTDFPYRDGDYSGWAWSGTAGNSASTGDDLVLPEPGRFLLV